MNNVSPSIQEKLGRNLHLVPNHPVAIIKELIQRFLYDYERVDDLSPVVSTVQNFDELLIAADHPARALSDTYYVDETHVLRTHTSAHQLQLLKQGKSKFLVTGDVYRKDAIDATHYPVFHQMEGVCLVVGEDPKEALQRTLITLVNYLFPNCQYRLQDDYFPFTSPSYEIEVEYDGRWIEVLGCGVIHPTIMAQAGRPNETGFAFGLGLERLAMILFGIPDIRYFWSTDGRFLKQFKAGAISSFKSYSKYPPVIQDMAFWHDENYHENNLNEIVRELGGDLVESLELIDSFTHPKTGRQSKCYRTVYRSNERSLTTEEINVIQGQIRETSADKLQVELR